MPVFTYEAVDRNGKAVRDRLEAGSKEDALRRIRSKGLKPTRISQSAQAGAAGQDTCQPGGPQVLWPPSSQGSISCSTAASSHWSRP